MKYMTDKGLVEFWRRHLESRETIYKEMADLPYEKKLEIVKKMKANHEAMRNAKKVDKEGG